MKEYGLDTDEQRESPLFFNSHHANITAIAVCYIINKYAHECIRDLPGHLSIATTEVYARADTEQKRKALETAYEKVGLTNLADIPSWEKDLKLKEFLKSLS